MFRHIFDVQEENRQPSLQGTLLFTLYLTASAALVKPLSNTILLNKSLLFIAKYIEVAQPNDFPQRISSEYDSAFSMKNFAI